jgi:signal transduction histidine kinase
LLRVSVLPAATVTLLGAAATAFLVTADPSTGATWAVLAAAAVGCVAVLIVAFSRADAVARALHQQTVTTTRGAQQWISFLQSSVADGQKDLQRLLDQVRRGERPALAVPESAPAGGHHPFAALEQDLRQFMYAAQAAVVQAASRQQVEVLVNLARRLQSLIHRAIKELDELEREVEDPELLKRLFSVDHLTTRVRRQVESLAVLGGAVPRRISSPVNMHATLRQAVAEVEHYSRVKVLPPIEGTLHGHAAADVIHLIAELIENATMFSPPDTQVQLRAHHVPAGLAVEIDDRGLPMPAEHRQRMNQLLAAPDHFDIGDLLKDGRIGLYVVASLARRHGILVQLQTNIYGGTQAVVVLPHNLLGDAVEDRQGSVPALATESSPAPPAAASHSAPASAQLAAVPSARPYDTDPRSAAAPPAVRTGQAGTVQAPTGSGTSATRPASERAAQDSPPAPTESASADAPAGHHPAGRGERPPLPRRSGTYLAPQLQEGIAPPNESAVPDMGLMAAFQRGRSRADEEDGPPDHTDR